MWSVLLAAHDFRAGEVKGNLEKSSFSGGGRMWRWILDWRQLKEMLHERLVTSSALLEKEQCWRNSSSNAHHRYHLLEPRSWHFFRYLSLLLPVPGCLGRKN